MKTLADFSSLYGDDLHDAVIRNINVSYGIGSHYPLIVVNLECMAPSRNYEWVSLEIRFYGIQEFKISKAYNTDSEVVFGSSANYWKGKIVFNFNTIDSELLSIEEHRESRFYVVCKEIDFEEKPTATA